MAKLISQILALYLGHTTQLAGSQFPHEGSHLDPSSENSLVLTTEPLGIPQILHFKNDKWKTTPRILAFKETLSVYTELQCLMVHQETPKE